MGEDDDTWGVDRVPGTEQEDMNLGSRAVTALTPSLLLARSSVGPPC